MRARFRKQSRRQRTMQQASISPAWPATCWAPMEFPPPPHHAPPRQSRNGEYIRRHHDIHALILGRAITGLQVFLETGILMEVEEGWPGGRNWRAVTSNPRRRMADPDHWRARRAKWNARYNNDPLCGFANPSRPANLQARFTMYRRHNASLVRPHGRPQTSVGGSCLAVPA